MREGSEVSLQRVGLQQGCREVVSMAIEGDVGRDGLGGYRVGMGTAEVRALVGRLVLRAVRAERLRMRRGGEDGKPGQCQQEKAEQSYTVMG